MPPGAPTEAAMLLEGRVALITGTGPNIGGEIARTLAGAGAHVVCLDVDEATAQRAAQSVLDAGHEAVPVQADVTDERDVERAVRTAVEAFGGLHLLVNNAAWVDRKTILDVTLEEWHRALGVVLTGAFLCSREAARQMISQGTPGAIVNMASTSGHRGKAHSVAYAAAKGGVLNLTRSLASQLAPYDIRVNSVTPTNTGLEFAAEGPRPERDNSKVPMSILRGRWGTPWDQAQAVLFLLSPNADFITGTDLPVDGGRLSVNPL